MDYQLSRLLNTDSTGTNRKDNVFVDVSVGVPALNTSYYKKYKKINRNVIGESIDSLCRDGADIYMQYLSKSHISPPQTC